MALTSPYDILSAYSRGEISSSQALAKLHLDGFRGLLFAMADAGHPLPKPSEEEIRSKLRDALPLLARALLPEPDSRAFAEHEAALAETAAFLAQLEESARWEPMMDGLLVAKTTDEITNVPREED